MNGIDILVLALIGISGIMSFRVGLIREAFALGALLVGLLAAVVLGRVYGPDLPDILGNVVATQVVFFLVCFLLFYLLVTLVGVLIGRIVKTMQLRWIDHLLGFLFGCIRGALAALLLLAGLTLVLPDLAPRHPELLSNSAVYRAADGPLRVLASVLPDQAEEALRERQSYYRERREERGRRDGNESKGSGLPLTL